MLYLCIHSNNIGEAYDIGERICKNKRVKDPPEIMYKVQTYINPMNGKRTIRRSYLTTAKIGN